jgi:hypothetical protein
MSAASDNLRTNQRQLDADGCEVGVSRQAVDETLEELDRLRRDCWHLVSMLEFLSEATGEGLELEDAALLDQIKAALPPQTREELPGGIAAQR